MRMGVVKAIAPAYVHCAPCLRTSSTLEGDCKSSKCHCLYHVALWLLGLYSTALYTHLNSCGVVCF